MFRLSLFLRTLLLVPCSHLTFTLNMTSEPSANANRYAPPPFDHPKADLILRSDDGVDFRVSTFILEISSEFFATMFKDGQPEKDERRDGCPIVRVQEHSKTLQTVLSLIYPVDPPVLDEIPHIYACLAAALKYDMKRVVSLTRVALRSTAWKAPLRTWAVAVRYGLEDEARVAAAEVVRQRIPVLDDFPPEMEEITAGPYFRLLQYECRARSAQELGASQKATNFCDAPMTSVDPFLSPTPSTNPQISSQSYNCIRPFADVIIRSADGHEFPVHKAFLSLASPTRLAAVLRLAHPARDGNVDITADITPSFADVVVVGDSLPVVPLEEDADTLAIVLGLCYPLSEGEVAVMNLQVLQGVTDAVKKYEMDGVKRYLLDRWRKASASDPLHAFIVATRYGADAEARQAARMLLDRQLEDYYSLILEVTPALTYRSLVKYDRACRKALQQAVQVYRCVDPSGEDTILLVKSATCRKYYISGGRHVNRKLKTESCCGVPVDLDAVSLQNACEPCMVLAATMAGAVQRMKTEPDALMTILESRDATSTSTNPLCSLCSQQDDFAKLTATYDKLYTLADSVIQTVRIALEH